MEIILLRDLHSLGQRGDVVQTKNGYARNFLLPKGLAVQATEANRNWFEQQRHKIDQHNTEERDSAVETATGLEGLEVTIAKLVSESETLYGSVTATDIAEAFEAIGHTIDRRNIDLGGGIKTLGEHDVVIRLHADVVANVKVVVVAEE
jgi:large subunit ribosomal protein L9